MQCLWLLGHMALGRQEVFLATEEELHSVRSSQSGVTQYMFSGIYNEVFSRTAAVLGKEVRHLP